MSKKNTAAPAAPATLTTASANPAAPAPLNTVPTTINTVPAALTAAPANNNFLAILAAILVSLNGQPGISCLVPSLLPSLQTLVQNAAGAPAVQPTAAAAQPAAPAPANVTQPAPANSASATAASAASSAVTYHTSFKKYAPGEVPAPQTYYDWMTTDIEKNFHNPMYRALAYRMMDCAWFARAFDLESNCRSMAGLNPNGDELLAFVRSWKRYIRSMRYRRTLLRNAAGK